MGPAWVRSGAAPSRPARRASGAGGAAAEARPARVDATAQLPWRLQGPWTQLMSAGERWSKRTIPRSLLAQRAEERRKQSKQHFVEYYSAAHL